MKTNLKNKRKGGVLIYTCIALTGMAALTSVAVDYGHVQLAKTELGGAADSAARAGAAMLPTGSSYAIAAAKTAAAYNKSDGTSVVLGSGDIQIGKWDKKALTFTPNASGPNACRVLTHRTNQTNNAISTPFASIIGKKSMDVNAESIAMVISPINVDDHILATANPFLSGAAKGTIASRINPHANPDFAGDAKTPAASPHTVNLPLEEGAALNFDSIDGTARHDPSLGMFKPDGELADIGHNNLTYDNGSSYGTQFYNENGIADVKAPINALVGIFLDDKDPNATAAPKNLDFSTDASRDFKELKPQLKQIFFIGDGLNSKGEKQNFVVPKGATRLFLATWDFYEWNNNFGDRNVKVTRPLQVITVK